MGKIVFSIVFWFVLVMEGRFSGNFVSVCQVSQVKVNVFMLLLLMLMVLVVVIFVSGSNVVRCVMSSGL